MPYFLQCKRDGGRVTASTIVHPRRSLALIVVIDTLNFLLNSDVMYSTP